MKKRSLWGTRFASCSTMLLLGGMAHAQTTPDDAPTLAQLESLQKEIAERAKQLEAMKRVLTERADIIRELRNTVDNEMLAHKRGGQAEVGAGATPGNAATGAAAAAAAASSATQINSTAQAQQTPSETPPQAVTPQDTQQGQAAQGEQQGESAAGAEQPVGNPPERDTRPPAIAPIFDQPGVLTPVGKIVVEPSFQYSYSYGDSVSLVGYTVIPAILVGLIDVRDIRTSTYISAFAFSEDILLITTFIQIPSSEYARMVMEETGRTAAMFPDNYKRMIVNGINHTAIQVGTLGLPEDGAEFFFGTPETTVDGVTVNEWMTAMIDGTDAWRNLVDEGLQ